MPSHTYPPPIPHTKKTKHVHAYPETNEHTNNITKIIKHALIHAHDSKHIHALINRARQHANLCTQLPEGV